MTSIERWKDYNFIRKKAFCNLSIFETSENKSYIIEELYVNFDNKSFCINFSYSNKITSNSSFSLSIIEKENKQICEKKYYVCSKVRIERSINEDVKNPLLFSCLIYHTFYSLSLSFLMC